MTKRKWAKGPVIRDPLLVVHLILTGRVLFICNKVQTQGWMVSHQLHMIASSARKGHYSLAIPIKKETEIV